MNYAEMVGSLTRRLGGNLYRVVGNDADWVPQALTEAQSQVANEMVAYHGRQAYPDYSTEGDSALLSADLPPISVDEDCTLPKCYHSAVVIGAAKLLSQPMGDANPKVKDPNKLEMEYQSAMNTAHKVYALELSRSRPANIMDAFAPDRHIEEEF